VLLAVSYGVVLSKSCQNQHYKLEHKDTRLRIAKDIKNVEAAKIAVTRPRVCGRVTAMRSITRPPSLHCISLYIISHGRNFHRIYTKENDVD
jgi:hypothetical protein